MDSRFPFGVVGVDSTLTLPKGSGGSARRIRAHAPKTSLRAAELPIQRRR